MPDTKMTAIWKIDAANPDPDLLRCAGDLLRTGKTVAFPTETVYGLGANALDVQAVGRIYEAKGRPSRNPIIVHVDSIEEARQLTTEWPETADLLARKFWPGPLTLVLKRNEIVPDIVTGGGDTVGIRVPAHPVALGLIRAAGVPIAAPSANRSEQLSPTRAEHVLRTLSGRIAAVLDAGPTSGGLESTVLSLVNHKITLLRPGLIAPNEIELLIGPVYRPDHNGSLDPGNGSITPLAAPGQMSRHYSPRAKLVLTTDEVEATERLGAAGTRIGVLTQSPKLYSELNSERNLECVLMPPDHAAYGEQLFAALHDLDAHGVSHIIVAAPPVGDSWLAIHDRLRRAASKR